MTDMLVVDASAFAEFLLGTPKSPTIAQHLRNVDVVHAPHVVVAEVISVLRGWARSNQLSDVRAQLALQDLADFPWQLWDERPFISAIWDLRHNCIAYDASYVALALGLRCPLLTTDLRLARLISSSPYAKNIRILTP